MKNSRTNIIRVFAAVLFAALVMVDIHVEIEHPISWDNTELSLTVQNAEAQVVHDFYMSTTTCWVDGKEISICRAEEGDLAVFLKDRAHEIEFENEKYLIVPHAAILLLIRDRDL